MWIRIAVSDSCIIWLKLQIRHNDVITSKIKYTSTVLPRLPLETQVHVNSHFVHANIINPVRRTIKKEALDALYCWHSYMKQYVQADSNAFNHIKLDNKKEAFAKQKWCCFFFFKTNIHATHYVITRQNKYVAKIANGNQENGVLWERMYLLHLTLLSLTCK